MPVETSLPKRTPALRDCRRRSWQSSEPRRVTYYESAEAPTVIASLPHTASGAIEMSLTRVLRALAMAAMTAAAASLPLGAQDDAVNGAEPFSSHNIKVATYFPFDAATGVFNKYRRTLLSAIAQSATSMGTPLERPRPAQKVPLSITYTDSAIEGDLSALISGEVNLACHGADVPPSATNLPGSIYFSKKPLFVEYTVLLARLNDQRFINGDLSSLHGAVVGFCEEGKASLVRLKGLARLQNAFFKEKDFPSAAVMTGELLSGSVDLCLMPVTDVPDGFKVIYNMGASPLYFVSLDASLIEQIDSAMTALEKENPFYMTEIMKRVGGGGSLNIPNFDAKEIAFVRSSRRSPLAAVTVHSNSAPFSHIDSALNFTGLDADLWKRLSRVSGIQFHYLDADRIPRNDLKKEKQAVNFIRLTNANSYSTHSGQKHYTGAIITHHERLYGRSGFDASLFMRGTKDNPGYENGQKAKIAMIREARIVLPFMNRWCKEYEVVLCDSLRDCLEKTSDGVTDLCLIDESFLRSMHNINEYPRLAAKKPVKLEVPISIEIKGPDAPVIKSILTKTLMQIPFEYFDRENIAAETQMGYVPSRHTATSRNAVGIVMFIFLLGSALLASSVIMSRRYKTLSETDDATGFVNLSKFIVLSQKFIDSPDFALQAKSRTVKSVAGEAATGDNNKSTFILTSISVLGFRHLNNTFGYEWGRRLLGIIADSLKEADTNHSMLITHCYDDIFYCLLRSSNKEHTTAIISNHVAQINETLVKSGFHVVIKSSAVYSSGEEGIRSMMDKADYARESISSEAINAKAALLFGTKGQSNFALFDKTLDLERVQENNIERHMRQAFDRNEITAVYQPKIDLRTGRLEGAEAFARWNSPELGVVMPNDFLPVFEKNGYALRFNFNMYTKVLSFLQSLIDRGNNPLPISMNITHLGIKPDVFVRRFEEVFSRFSVPPTLLEFELSETALGMTGAELHRLSSLLHERGFSVAMDDFGTGGSSLSILGSVPSDVVKFDQRLLSDSDTSNGSRIILTKLVEMSHQLGRKVLCKCVEKKAQVELLRKGGCDMVQGFYYSAALPPEEFRDYMESSL